MTDTTPTPSDPTDRESHITWCRRLGNPYGPMGRAQVSRTLNNTTTINLPEQVLRLAQAEYEHQYGTAQDYEEMQRRHGLSVLEVVALLADLAERHGAKPTKPRGSGRG